MTDPFYLLDGLSSETVNIIGYLEERPLERRRIGSADERRRWAVRDFRTVVADAVHGEQGRRMTLEEADQALRNIETRERVWQYLESRP
ncbi:hypothetical protein [Leifsonia sp. Le1]|uniref:hypothetical protein n=1 Tax=Leifsonia sp. Le1 TaxID=3404918 RepID=UPI003EBCBAA6